MLTCLYQVSAGETGEQWERLVKFYSFFMCAYLCNIPTVTRSIQNFTAFFAFGSTVKRKHMLEVVAVVVFLPLK